jgi:catechol 2,3-dioxygenase-like lactoylglutathione lyase family enzyme
VSVALHSVLPILLVPDVRRAAAQLQDQLGLRVCWIMGDAPHLYSIVDYAEGEGFHLAYSGDKIGRKNRHATSRRDSRKSVQQSSAEPTGEDAGLDAYIRVDDADRWHAALKRRGAKILYSPIVRPWRMKEFEVEDAHGFVFCFGADLTGAWTKGSVTTSPQFTVSDVERTAAFYRDALAFPDIAVFGTPPQYGIASRDGVTIHFARAHAQGEVRANRAAEDYCDAAVEASGLDELARELHGRDVSLAHGPETTEYGMRELEVVDPDGYALLFSEPEAGWGDRSNAGRAAIA